jgi:hypothetical protein
VEGGGGAGCGSGERVGGGGEGHGGGSGRRSGSGRSRRRRAMRYRSLVMGRGLRGVDLPDERSGSVVGDGGPRDEESLPGAVVI